MSAAPIVAGARFRGWTVIDSVPRYSATNRVVLCECDCGHRGDIQIYALRHGLSSACRSCAKRAAGVLRAPDYPIGTRFGEWEIIGTRDRGIVNPRVPCRCMLCGTERSVLLMALVRGKTTRCNECRAAAKFVEIEPGTRRGGKVAIDWRDGDSVRVRCDCGHEFTMGAHAFRRVAGDACPRCAPRRSLGIDLGGGVLMVDLAREVGVSRQRIHQLVSRGETVETIRSGAYRRRPGPRRRRIRCGACGARGHNVRSCAALEAAE